MDGHIHGYAQSKSTVKNDEHSSNSISSTSDIPGGIKIIFKTYLRT